MWTCVGMGLARLPVSATCLLHERRCVARRRARAREHHQRWVPEVLTGEPVAIEGFADPTATKGPTAPRRREGDRAPKSSTECGHRDLRKARIFANLSDSWASAVGVAVSEVRARWVEFKELSHALASTEDETSRLQMVVDSAPSIVPGCDHAGVTLNAKGGVVTRVSSDDVVRRANDLQYELGEGPCLNIRRDQDTLVSNDLTREDRWSRWAKHVNADLGVHAMMSLLIYTDRESFGALSLYASRAQGFDPDDVAIGQGLAGHLAAIMAAGREIDQLGTAMHNRTIIGQAQGILMYWLDIDADQAFDYLRRMSSHCNRKLVDVAAEVARTRRLPDQGSTRSPGPFSVGSEGPDRPGRSLAP